jgi:hypothetical protein
MENDLSSEAVNINAIINKLSKLTLAELEQALESLEPQ